MPGTQKVAQQHGSSANLLRTWIVTHGAAGPAQQAMLLEGADRRRPVRTWQPEMGISRQTLYTAGREDRKIRDVRTAVDTLPNDIETLERLVIEKQARIEQHDAPVRTRDARLLERVRA